MGADEGISGRQLRPQPELETLGEKRLVIGQIALPFERRAVAHVDPLAEEVLGEGAREAPSLMSAFGGDGFSLFIKQVLVFAIALGALWLAADFNSETIFWVVNIAIVLLLPASIIRLALSKELGAALSPDQVG